MVGRHIRDYFPDYDEAAGKALSARKSLRELLRIAADDSGRADRRSGAAREAIVLLLATYGQDHVRSAHTWRELTRVLSPEELTCVRAVVLRGILGEYKLTTESHARTSIETLLQELSKLTESQSLSTAMPDEWFKDAVDQRQPGNAPSNLVKVEVAGVEIPIHVATIAAVKGETHLATLVLESCLKMVYDLQTVLPYLCGARSASGITDDALKGRLMNVFVASTRPRRLLAFAMHSDRIASADRAKLVSLGWDVFDWTAPEAASMPAPSA